MRNFGFVTVTGQQAGDCWRRALRSRDVWAEIAPQAGIAIAAARAADGRAPAGGAGRAGGFRRDARWARTAGCCAPREIAAYGEGLRTGAFAGALYSPHEVRVESREAIPKLAAWLAERHGVTFLRETAVRTPRRRGWRPAAATIEAEAVVVCPGDDFHTLHADRIAAYGLTRCKLHMMRLAPERYDARLPVVMSDLGLVRYLGYAELPPAPALQARLEAEQGAQLEHGVHLIVARSADGSLVVGDSHHYGATPDPFAPSFVDDLILEEYAAVFDGAAAAGGRALDRNLRLRAGSADAEGPARPTPCASC